MQLFTPVASGENSPLIRSKVLSHLAILRPEIDPELNDQDGKKSNGRITTGTGLLCLVIPTNEELMIARETDLLVS
jgi:acetate kinase